MLESREVGRDTSSSFFSFLSGCVGLGGEQVEQKLEEEKKEKEYHENFRNALRCIRPKKMSSFYPAPKTHHVSIATLNQ